MGLSPKEMSIKIVQNLRSKTGKDLQAWFKNIDRQDLKEKKAIKAWLKDQGLGNSTAMVIADRYLHGGVGEYDDGPALEDQLFSGRFEGYRPLYDQLKKEILAMGEDVTSSPCKTYIPFSRKKQFVIAQPKKDGLIVGLALGETDSTRVKPAKGLGGSDRISHMVVVESADDFKDLMAVIQEAYAKNG